MVNYNQVGIVVQGVTIPVEQVMRNVYKKEIIEKDLVLFIINWERYRGFDGVTETFVIPKSNIEEIKNIILDKHIYFGEIAGKHSDIEGTIQEQDINVEQDKNIIMEFMVNNVSKHRANYSFIDWLIDNSEDISEADKVKLNQLIYQNK